MTKFLNRGIPLMDLYKDGTFILLSISEYREYKDGKPTNNVAGQKYEVVDPLSYDKIVVKIPGQMTPLLLPEVLAELRENGEKVLVEFVNAIDKLYLRRDGSSVSVEDSFSAEDVLLVEQS